VTAIFIGLITFVAGLNILVVLSMTVTDKARDVAVLMSMGCTRQQIRRIFLWQGIAIGGTGTLAGLCVGYAFAWIAGTYHVIPLDPQVYAVPYVPFHPSLLDGLWIAIVAMGISVGATLLPARAAAKLLPVDILRMSEGNRAGLRPNNPRRTIFLVQFKLWSAGCFYLGTSWFGNPAGSQIA